MKKKDKLVPWESRINRHTIIQRGIPPVEAKQAPSFISEAKVTYKENWWEFATWVLVILIVVVGGALIMSRSYVNMLQSQNYIIPMQYAGVWLSLDGRAAVVVLDLKDPAQRQATQDLQAMMRIIAQQRGIQ